MGQLADKVKARREELNLSQMELGERLGLTDGRSYFSRIEAGKLLPSRARLDAIERALCFLPNELQVAALYDEQAQPTTPQREVNPA
ncbi:hypothetical protein Dxin01_04046 [Deinococcus xinjiangensis]|uniref:HTH cro/C1-type domain-containing protein n=1 Tax=Deinococcus xinjiangensis TaxID=457454 RepID=A0ABP9VKT1_9DEIO